LLSEPFWDGNQSEKNKSAKNENWYENFTFSYIAQDGVAYEIKCFLYMLEEQLRDYSTIKYIYRGKSIKNYTFINNNPNKPLTRNQYGGTPHNPKSIVKQKGQRVSSYTRGFIDFTNVGKSLDGKNIDLSDYDIDQIEITLGELFRKTRLYTMMLNYKKKKKINPVHPPKKDKPENDPGTTNEVGKLIIKPEIPADEKITKKYIENQSGSGKTCEYEGTVLCFSEDKGQFEAFDYKGIENGAYLFTINIAGMEEKFKNDFILILIMFLHLSNENFSKSKLNDMWKTYTSIAGNND
jgi:hypothetical protein